MEKYRLEELSEDGKEFPECSGVVSFWQTDKMLYCRKSSNIRSYIMMFLHHDVEDRNLGEMIEKTEYFSYQPAPCIFDAFLLEKQWLYSYAPSFNQRYRDYDSYQYLGLNFVKPPFLTIKNDTTRDFFYIGPFRDIYLVRDSIDVLSRTFSTPACTGEEYPCYLAEIKQCKGYCVRQQEHLAADLVKHFLLPEQENLSRVETQRQSLIKELKFRKADELSEFLRILKRFYSRITFLSVTKRLNLSFSYQGRLLNIENGLLKSDGEYQYENPQLTYQANEQFCVDKSELDERWILFNHVKKLFPDELRKSFEANREQLRRYLLNKNER